MPDHALHALPREQNPPGFMNMPPVAGARSCRSYSTRSTHVRVAYYRLLLLALIGSEMGCLSTAVEHGGKAIAVQLVDITMRGN